MVFVLALVHGAVVMTITSSGPECLLSAAIPAIHEAGDDSLPLVAGIQLLASGQLSSKLISTVLSLYMSTTDVCLTQLSLVSPLQAVLVARPIL